MPHNYISGKDGYVLVNDAEFAFDKWGLKVKTKTPSVKNFTSQGFEETVKGFTDGTISLSGPYDQGNMPLESGEVYEFHLGWKAGIEIVVNARVQEIGPDVNADDADRVSVTALSQGVFTAAIS